MGTTSIRSHQRFTTRTLPAVAPKLPPMSNSLHPDLVGDLKPNGGENKAAGTPPFFHAGFLDSHGWCASSGAANCSTAIGPTPTHPRTLAPLHNIRVVPNPQNALPWRPCCPCCAWCRF
jgi:hypothetical protein